MNEKRMFKIIYYVFGAIICMLLLSMCVSTCSRPKTVSMGGVSYPVDQNGTPYMQGPNGQGYVPAPGYVNQSQPIRNDGPGFWSGALIGAGGGYLASKVLGQQPAPAPPAYHAPAPTYAPQAPAPVYNTPAPAPATKAVVNAPNPGPAVVSKPVTPAPDRSKEASFYKQQAVAAKPVPVAKSAPQPSSAPRLTKSSFKRK